LVPFLVVVGEDGSCCLLRWKTIKFILLTAGMPIVRVCADVEQCLIALETLDSAFAIYSLQSPAPICQMTELPRPFATIWQLSQFDRQSQNATHIFTVRGSALFFTTYSVIDDGPSEITPFVHSLMRHVTKPRSMSGLSLVSREEINYVFLGAANAATFFYPPYGLAGPAAYHSSRRRAAAHYLSYLLTAEALGATPMPFRGDDLLADIFQEMLRFVTSPDARIRTMAVIACVNSIHTLSSGQCKHHIRTIDWGSSGFVERLLISISMSRSDGVSKGQRRQTLDFLRGLTERDSPDAWLALVVLINGFELWSEVLPRKVVLAAVIRPLVTKRMLTEPKEVAQLFSMFADAQFPLLVELVRDVVARDGDSARSHCQLLASVSVQNPTFIGSRGTAELAMIAAEWPACAGVVEGLLIGHLKLFWNVARSKQLFVVGTGTGWLDVFKGNQMIAKECIGAGIDSVAVHPGEKRIAAVSAQEMAIRVLQLGGGGLRLLKTKSVAALPVNPESVWEESDEK
jgi:hypothetical protein